ncbi:hypothetical protein BJY52DRAFT_1275617 [Lactarius psammicola]|nr:hypothetical protein BJY52DRAFT_1275617 [Lactarius psammicola]
MDSEEFEGGAETLVSIQSMWERLKQEFRIVKELRTASEQTVTASRAVWDAYIKTHPMANKFRKKPFPLYGTKAKGKKTFRAAQTSAFRHDRSPSLDPHNYRQQRGKTSWLPQGPLPSDRKRSKSTGTSASQSQKIRRVSLIRRCPK